MIAITELLTPETIIRGMRVSVELVLSLMAHGESVEAILNDYPGLEPEDIRACVAYADASGEKP